jgi:hypothetical protein
MKLTGIDATYCAVKNNDDHVGDVTPQSNNTSAEVGEESGTKCGEISPRDASKSRPPKLLSFSMNHENSIAITMISYLS